jgi:hypothetical protein
VNKEENPISSSDQNLTTSEKVKRNAMEKSAGWWNKYYASKAKLVENEFCFFFLKYIFLL